MPVPYPNIVLVGFAAGGRDGNISPLAPPAPPNTFRCGPRDAGRDEGGVARGGFADADAELSHGVADELIRGVGPARMKFAVDADAAADGSPGKGFPAGALVEPHDP